MEQNGSTNVTVDNMKILNTEKHLRLTHGLAQNVFALNVNPGTKMQWIHLLKPLVCWITIRVKSASNSASITVKEIILLEMEKVPVD